MALGRTSRYVAITGAFFLAALVQAHFGASPYAKQSLDRHSFLDDRWARDQSRGHASEKTRTGLAHSRRPARSNRLAPIVKNRAALILAKEYPPSLGGVQSYSEQLAKAYLRLGLRVFVLTQFPGPAGLTRRDGVIILNYGTVVRLDLSWRPSSFCRVC